MSSVIYVLVVCLLIVPSILSYDVNTKCSKKYCEDYEENAKCQSSNDFCNKNPNSTHFLYPDTCNCCQYCLKNIEKGEFCIIGQPGGVPPTEICGPGLQCMQSGNEGNKCQRIKNVCTQAQDDFDKRKKEGTLGMTEVRPQCDEDGFFKAVHCIPGSICYCRAPTGERIFGELPYLDYEDQDKMTCACSLNAWKAQHTLDPKYDISVARCTEIGTYDQLQCMFKPNSSCFCVDSETGSPVSNVEMVAEVDVKENQPPCFDASRHVPGKYMTDCEAELERHSKYLAAKEGGDNNLLEAKKPLCQPDGKFSRTQLSGSKKVCADSNGKQIAAYEAEIGTGAEKSMDCNCARTQWLLSQAGVVELPACCANGNFEAWQCFRNECFCVDQDGNQIGVEVGIDDKSELECYKSGEGKPCLPLGLFS